MSLNVTYPKGGSNFMWEPIHITVSLPQARGFSIQGRTYTRDGFQIILLDKDQKEMSNYTYVRSMMELLNPFKAAKDIAQDMNILLELEGIDATVDPKELTEVMKEVLQKCESRYGNRLPDSDYEALVLFQ